MEYESPLVDSEQVDGEFAINAMFPDGQRKMYTFNYESKIQDLIDQIQNDDNIKKPEGRIICAMYRGKILENHEKISDLDSFSGFTVSILFRMPPKEKHLNKKDKELKGFDRLERMNYTPQQIQEIRHQFHTMRGSLNDSIENKYNAEEEWLPVIFNSENPLELFRAEMERPEIPQEEYSDENAPTYEYIAYNRISPGFTFLIGFLLGMIFGPASLFFLIVSYKDTVGISGIISGILLSKRSFIMILLRRIIGT